MADLKNKTDKKIKRYLKSVAEDYKESKVYNSIHYMVILNGCVKDIRFSDHLSSRSSPFINVIKCTDDIYQIWYNNGDKMTCNSDNVVDYIKSYILMYDKFAEYNQVLRNQVSTLEKELQKVNRTELYKQLKSYQDKFQNKTQELEETKTELQNKITKFKNLKNKINTLFQTFDKIEQLKIMLNTMPNFNKV